jgi:hypothetical protein
LLINARLPRSEIEGGGVGLVGRGNVREQELGSREIFGQSVSDWSGAEVFNDEILLAT